ncbi:acyl-CoA thioesterase [Cetobacterium sp. SF1]|uniref:acyl-CoA thioesterase n=1 Tax=unclassified Cetobacterium TaxID=2630983 RepID=UPI003CF99CC9
MFSIDYKVGVKDINYGGHMGNEIPLQLFQQCRVDFFLSHDLSELNIGENVGVIQKNSYVSYNKEVFLGDLLKISITNIELTKISFNVFYTIFRGEELVVEGSTLLVAFNYEKGKPTKIPESFKSLCSELFRNI